MNIYTVQTTSCTSFVADPRDAIASIHFADRRLWQLPTLQATQVAFTEPDSAVSAFFSYFFFFFFFILKVCGSIPSRNKC